MSRKFRYQKPNQNDRQYNNQNNRHHRQYNSEHDRRTTNQNVHNRLGPRVHGNFSRNSQRRNYNQSQCEEKFFKVTIPNGQRYEESYIINLLRQNFDDMDNPIIFYQLKKEQGALTFFVEGQEKADTLRCLSRRITTHNGQCLSIITERSSVPKFHLNDCLPVIKAAMSSRYDAQNHIMNLKQFRYCELFKQNGVFFMFHIPSVLRHIIQMIQQNAPDTIAINLSDNQISNLEPLQNLVTMNQLKALDLSKNKIKNINELEHLKNLELIELVLEGNPLMNNFQSTTSYVSAVRKIFKNLKTLDKEDLPDQIGFDLGISGNIPQTKDSFIPDENLKNFITGFLQEYYRMYDSESRQQLMVAYHETATFTLSISLRNPMYKGNERLNELLKKSHNLLRIKNDQWVEMVKTSNIDIVSFLSKLPVTKHSFESFQVDIPFFSNEFINVVVNGVFQEISKQNNPLRAFCRTFFLVPHNNGFVIVNEMFLISDLSKTSISEKKELILSGKTDRIMKDCSDKPIDFDLMMTTNVSTISNNTTTFAGTSTSTSMLNQREEIIQKFKQATKMNLSFSIKCLEENGFDAERAFEVFSKLQQANALPPEAFIE